MTVDERPPPRSRSCRPRVRRGRRPGRRGVCPAVTGPGIPRPSTDPQRALGGADPADPASDGNADDGDGEHCDDADADRGQHLQLGSVGGLTQDAAAVRQDENEDQDDGGDQPVQDLGVDQQLAGCPAPARRGRGSASSNSNRLISSMAAPVSSTRTMPSISPACAALSRNRATACATVSEGVVLTRVVVRCRRRRRGRSRAATAVRRRRVGASRPAGVRGPGR